MAGNSGDASMRGRIAAYERWARTGDRTAATAPARAGLDATFAAEVDPDGSLGPEELARRIAAKRSAHFTRLARKSAESRRRGREARRIAQEAQAVASARQAAAELRRAADEMDAAAAGPDS
jgi:hypothetical protein